MINNRRLSLSRPLFDALKPLEALVDYLVNVPLKYGYKKALNDKIG